MFVETKEAGEVQQAPAKVLKLSEAMRIGAGIRPQTKCDLFNEHGSCALGAAYEGATGSRCYPWQYSLVTNAFPSLGDPSGKLNRLGREIFRRNDDGDTRETIADWLESQGY